VVDLLHEVELGVWKNTFIHLLRLLHAAAPAGWLVTELDRRYSCIISAYHVINSMVRFRQVPTFGRSTIRRFSTNASEMKKLAARDYEDLLQVSISLLSHLPIY
jgi:hypothetical protein